MDAVYSIGGQGRIMRRLLGRSGGDSSQENTVTSSPGAPPYPYRPQASQNAAFTAGAPIACLDRSPNGQSAVLASRHILKTVTFDGLVIHESVDVRAHLAGNSDQLSIRDVKWGSSLGGSPTIFTACAGGKIFQYDLSRVSANATDGHGVDYIQTREDTRQVNTLDVQPHRGTWLLSGSQDGIVRCFDIRVPIETRTGPSYRAVQAFKCNADGVRRVQWSPKDGFLFACGTEQGVVLKWDVRKSNAPVLRINAHDKTCSTIAWHPDGDHLISGGWDSKCHVWDVSKTAERRQKPKWTISTPAPVATIAWRPAQWSATAQAKRASQIAISYDESSQKRFGINAVHIWDLARPTLPFREVQRFDTSPSALLWHNQYLLWTAGQDGVFNQCDINYAPKVLDRQSVSAFNFSARGDVLSYLDERLPSRRPRTAALQEDEGTPLASYSSSPATTRFSVSRSDSEDDAIGSFLGPRHQGGRKRRPSVRLTANMSTTPPSGSGTDDVLPLEQAIKITGIYKPFQVMTIGHVPGGVNVDEYQFLSANYLEILHQHLPYTPGAKPLPDRINTILDQYIRAAQKTTQFRLGAVWAMIKERLALLLKQRAQYHFESRMDSLRRASPKKKSDAKLPSGNRGLEMSIDLSGDGEATPRKVMSSTSLDSRATHTLSLLSRELESTSNVPTPVARPVPDNSEVDHVHGSMRGKKLTPIIEPESFTLPPAIHEHTLEKRKRLDSEPLSVVSHSSETTQASTEGYDFYDAEAISKAMDVPHARPSAPPVLDYRPPGSPSRVRKPVIRHDSDDSFAQVFSVSEGSRRTTGLASSSDGSVPTRAIVAASIMGTALPAGSSEDGEYSSRIRGKHIEQSPSTQSGFPVRRQLERTDTNFSVFTDEHNLITQTTSDSFESPYPSQTNNEFHLGSPAQNAPSVEAGEGGDDRRSPFIIETDYLPWPSDPPCPFPFHAGPRTLAASVLHPYRMIASGLQFEAKKSALNASAMILLLKPLVPDDLIDSFQAAAILRQQHTRLMSLKLFVEASLLRKLCMKGWPGGALSVWGDDYPAVFNPAHQGIQAGFMCSSCRKPREIDRSASSIDSIWRCNRCKSLMSPCAVCGHRDAPPDIPLPPKTTLPNSDAEGPLLATWWYCPGCKHGGHSSCLQAWHASFEADDHPENPFNPSPLESSDGCCPFDGCGHACLPGRGRDETSAARTEEVTRAVREAARSAARMFAGANKTDPLAEGGAPRRVGTPASDAHTIQSLALSHSGGVRSDGDVVAQSRAVESVRGELAGHGQGGGHGGGGRMGLGGTAGGILSSSPGRGHGFGERTERERRKSVKFVAGVGSEER